MSTPLPRCCTPLDADWPLPVRLDGAQLVSTRVDPAHLALEDFDRLGLAAPKAVAKRQAEYLAGRTCAHAALAQLTGQGALPASDDEGAPLWPAGAVGSITHGKGWAGAVVGQASRWQGLGLDVESLIPTARADRLAAEILSPAEYRRYPAGSDAERSLHATLAFSLKESLFKALFPLVRQRFYFHDAELLESQGTTVRLRLLADLGGDWPAGRELTGQFCRIEGYLLSLVAIAR